MSTYTFQQNYPNGAANGYVQCEMSPAPGEVSSRNYKLNLTVFDKNYAAYQVSAYIKPPAGVTGDPIHATTRNCVIPRNTPTKMQLLAPQFGARIIPAEWYVARCIDCPVQFVVKRSDEDLTEVWTVGTSSQTIRQRAHDLRLQIRALDFARVALSGQDWVESDEGTAIMGSLAITASINAQYGLTIAKFDIACSDGTTSTVNLTQAQIEAARQEGGITETQPGIFANVLFDASKKYTVTLTIGDDFETVSQQFELSDAFTNLHLSGCGKGVAVGKYSVSTVSAPLFECQYPAVFYDDVAVAADGLFKLVDVANTSTVPSGSSNFSRTLTSTDFTNAVADGYVPVALAGFGINSYLWFVYNCGMSTSGVTMSVTRRDSSTGSSASMTLSAKVLMVKML